MDKITSQSLDIHPNNEELLGVESNGSLQMLLEKLQHVLGHAGMEVGVGVQLLGDEQLDRGGSTGAGHGCGGELVEMGAVMKGDFGVAVAVGEDDGRSERGDVAERGRVVEVDGGQEAAPEGDAGEEKVGVECGGDAEMREAVGKRLLEAHEGAFGPQRLDAGALFRVLPQGDDGGGGAHRLCVDANPVGVDGLPKAQLITGELNGSQHVLAFPHAKGDGARRGGCAMVAQVDRQHVEPGSRQRHHGLLKDGGAARSPARARGAVAVDDDDEGTRVALFNRHIRQARRQMPTVFGRGECRG